MWFAQAAQKHIRPTATTKTNHFPNVKNVVKRMFNVQQMSICIYFIVQNSHKKTLPTGLGLTLETWQLFQRDFILGHYETFRTSIWIRVYWRLHSINKVSRLFDTHFISNARNIQNETNRIRRLVFSLLANFNDWSSKFTYKLKHSHVLKINIQMNRSGSVGALTSFTDWIAFDS